MTYSQAAATLKLLPVFTQNVLAAINANFDSNFDTLTDSLGYPTSASIDVLAPLVGVSVTDFATRINTYIATKYIVDECRRILGLPVSPTLIFY